MLLAEATNQQGAAKVGLFGTQGSGKTTTGALIALGLSKTYHGGAPVAMMDTENGSDFLKPIFDAEGVKLLVHKSRAFRDMLLVLKEAETAGCCGFLMDSVTHSWAELQESFCKQRHITKIQFEHWRWLKGPEGWGAWTTAFLNSKLHCIVCGRAGYEYEYQTNEETGKKDLVKGASKMRAEGEFGYEPNLLLELESERRFTAEPHHKGGLTVHLCHVLKDRARAVNGKTFEFADINTYKTGDWKRVFNPFMGHWTFLNIAGGVQKAIDPNRTSEAMFPGTAGDTAYQERARRAQIATEEIQGTLTALWPGQETLAKRLKQDVLEVLFKTRSWTAVERLSVDVLERGTKALKAFEVEYRKPDNPDKTEVGAIGMLMAVLEEFKQREDEAVL